MQISSLPDGVAVIDTHHLGRPHVVATYALLGDEPGLVDPGPPVTLPAVEAGLAAHGVALGDIRHIVLTHIHLDHAGASGAIVARSPGAHVYVHERGAPHLIDPARLIGSAAQLWGDRLDTLWGRPVPVPAERITTFSGGERIMVGQRRLDAYDAPGHAKHHLVWHDAQAGIAFVGDNCGVRLPGVAFTRPAAPPPDVDLEAWQRTLDLIQGLAPRWLMLTHFGPFDDAGFHIADFRERLVRWAELVRDGLLSGASEADQIAALNRLGAAEAASLGAPEQAALSQQSGDLSLSWRGLARYWQKRGVPQGS